MKQVFLLVFILIPVLYGLEINHGDEHNTKTRIGPFREYLEIYTYQEHDGGLYFAKNEETGVKVKYMKSETPNEKDAVINNNLQLKNGGQDYKFDYSTSNQLTREEEGNHVKEADGSDVLEVKGTYSYVDSAGTYYIQGYTADKNGFRTKVSFGPKIKLSFSGLKSQVGQAPPGGGKGIDGALFCSLVGGGCKK